MTSAGKRSGQNPFKLRVEGIDDEITPRELKEIFKQYGKVEEVVVYAGRNVVYAVITMSERGADHALYSDPRPKRNGIWLSVRIANRSRGPWLSPTWRPPQEYWYR